ncbi:S1 RNA-binding domain-containing protein [Flavicella sediminum]|uniref:DNA-binding protein n=1 Tax=Flavicella sediminum TaxID=2585141 RepID=UPI00111F8071|nr:DNA-binding protein [Flavicella sediminum]
MDLEIGEQVDLVIGRFTNVGISVLVNGEYEGMLYKNEVFKRVREDQKITGFVKFIREDGKLDISLQPIGFLNKIGENENAILEKLKSLDGGFIGLNDKSSPDDIKYHFKMSKKSFKSAIGGLYKAKLIVISSKGIHLTEDGE